MSAPPDAVEPALKAGDTLAGRYRLVRLLGEGGMGYVWEGRHIATDKAVAIKALKGATDADAARLLREARLSASLTHRNIVQVFDFCEPEGGGPVFMVMELLAGETLGAYLQRAGPLGFEEARTVGLAVAAAMRLAHAKGIVHRDLKPDNVFLARAETEAVPEIKVLDFGIAKPTVVDAQLTSITRTGSVIGTPHYMAPEQIYAEKDIDGRADIWALGVVLYECLAGIKPFDGESFGQVFRKVTQGEVRSLVDVAPSVPRGMSELVMSMLTLDRNKRPTSTHVHDALEGFVSSAGPTALQQTQWLPAPFPPSGGSLAARSLSPSPPRTPRMSGSVTPPALATAPSIAVRDSANSALRPRRSPPIAVIAGSAAAAVAVVALVALFARPSYRSPLPVDLGPVVGAASSAPKASLGTRSDEDAPPLPNSGTRPLAPSSAPLPVAELPDAHAPQVASGSSAPGTTAAAASTARPNAKTPKPGAPQRPMADPLGGGRF